MTVLKRLLHIFRSIFSAKLRRLNVALLPGFFYWLRDFLSWGTYFSSPWARLMNNYSLIGYDFPGLQYDLLNSCSAIELSFLNHLFILSLFQVSLSYINHLFLILSVLIQALMLPFSSHILLLRNKMPLPW